MIGGMHGQKVQDDRTSNRFKIIDLPLVDNEEATESIIFDLQVVVLKVQRKFDTGWVWRSVAVTHPCGPALPVKSRFLGRGEGSQDVL